MDTGLVLGGGGGKGIYQVGMLKSLAEAGVLDDVVAMAGTSIGSVNAALMAEGMYDKAYLAKSGNKPMIAGITQMYEVWQKIDMDVFFDLDMASIKAGDRHFSRKETEKLIKEYVDFKNVQLPVFCTVARCPEGMEVSDKISEYEMQLIDEMKPDVTFQNFTAEYINIQGTSDKYIGDVILATTALPVIYKPVDINGTFYIDGGVKDNVPIKPLYDMGIRRFIVIELSSESVVNPADFPDAEIISILPSHDLGDLFDGTMNFTKKDKSIKYELGVRDGKRYVEIKFHGNKDAESVESYLAKIDYEAAKKQVQTEMKYDKISSEVNSHLDYFNKLEEKYK